MKFHYKLTPQERDLITSKRVQVGCDYLKTICFGSVAASVITPIAKDGNFGVGGIATLAVAGLILGAMLIKPDWLR